MRQGKETDSSISGGDSLNAALDALAKRREREAEAALLVTRQTARARWRSCSRTAPGACARARATCITTASGASRPLGRGADLRAGGLAGRLGTDQLTYTADDRIKVTARLRDTDLNPVKDEALHAELFRDNELVSSTPMTAVEGSNGLHEVELPALPRSGRYEVRLRGKEADRLVAEDGGSRWVRDSEWWVRAGRWNWPKPPSIFPCSPQSRISRAGGW